MGVLRHFNLGELISRYDLRVFVETGTGRGDALRYAGEFPFRRLYSVEIIPEQAELLRRQFDADPRVELHCGESPCFLEQVLPRVGTEPVLFWLDAHYPGADLGLAPFDAESDPDRRLPLERELEVIRRLRPAGHDVILIDDLRIYENGPFGSGNLPRSPEESPPGSGFINAGFAETHEFRRDDADQGYLMLLPRQDAYATSRLSRAMGRQ